MTLKGNHTLKKYPFIRYLLALFSPTVWGNLYAFGQGKIFQFIVLLTLKITELVIQVFFFLQILTDFYFHFKFNYCSMLAV